MHWYEFQIKAVAWIHWIQYNYEHALEIYSELWEDPLRLEAMHY